MPGRRMPRGHPIIAWFFIILGCAAAIGLRFIDKEPQKPGDEDPLGVLVMELQGKYMIGITQWQGDNPMIYGQAKTALNLGSIEQRQRFVILAGELVDDAEAAEQLAQLDALMEEARNNPDAAGQSLELSEKQTEIHQLLRMLYPQQPIAVDDSASDTDGDQTTTAPETSNEPTAETRGERVDALTPAQHDLLINEFGYFGKLALGPPDGGGDQALRKQALSSATFVVITIFSMLGLGGLVGFVGLVGLILLLVFALTGKIHGGMPLGHAHHGVYAETFAVWMILFFAIQKPASTLGSLVPGLPMLPILVAFFGSLLALLWPVLRGVPWRMVREDIGWTGGRKPALEPLMGVAGYFMALPLLGIGVLMFLGLALIQKALSPEPGPFDPTGGPAHPIIQNLAGNDWLLKLQVLALASIAAPIVEETMFRGVLYRHLRDASRWMGPAVSIVLSGTINAFIFAAIHPQGWVAIPALMALAYAFIIMREWRGTLIPCMLIHGISNGIVMTMAMLILGA